MAWSERQPFFLTLPKRVCKSKTNKHAGNDKIILPNYNLHGLRTVKKMKHNTVFIFVRSGPKEREKY